MISSCQDKEIEFFILSRAIDNSMRKLELKSQNSLYYYKKKKTRSRKNIENPIEIIESFTKVYLNDNSESCYKYKSKKKIQNENFIITFNPENKFFFGEVCFSQNITWLLENDYNLINCYFINNKKPFGLKIVLKIDLSDN